MGQVRRRWYLFRPKACHFKFKLRYTCTHAGFCRRKRQDTPDVIHPLVDQPKQRLRGRMRQDTVKSGEIVQLKPALRVYIGCPRYRVHRQRLISRGRSRPARAQTSFDLRDGDCILASKPACLGGMRLANTASWNLFALHGPPIDRSR